MAKNPKDIIRLPEILDECGGITEEAFRDLRKKYLGCPAKQVGRDLLAERGKIKQWFRDVLATPGREELVRYQRDVADQRTAESYRRHHRRKTRLM